MNTEELKLKLLEKAMNKRENIDKNQEMSRSGYVSNPIYKDLLAFHSNNKKIGDKFTVKDLLR